MYETRVVDQRLMRQLNLSLVLNALRLTSPLSRAKLAHATGLNKATVSSLVEELIDTGFVSELGPERTGRTGRPEILLELDRRAGGLIGAEIGVDFISVVIANFAAEIIWRYFERTVPETSETRVLNRLLEIVRQGIRETPGQYDRILGLALGVPGLVDVSSGTLLFAPNLHWHEVPLRSLLEAEFEFPIYVHNEANLAALGESFFGAARDVRSLLYVSSGVGLGGGIVLDGQLVSGATGLAGEIGHMTLVLDGPQCNCGNRGCWETLVSQEAVFQRVRAAIDRGQHSQLQELTHGDLTRLTIPLVVQAAKRGDHVALAALEETAFYLGVGIANLVNALNPEAVVFGGVLSLASDFLMPTIQRVIQERALRWLAKPLRLLVATHGFDACVMGGVALVYQQVLSRPFRATRVSTQNSRQTLASPQRFRDSSASAPRHVGAASRGGGETHDEPQATATSMRGTRQTPHEITAFAVVKEDQWLNHRGGES